MKIDPTNVGLTWDDDTKGKLDPTAVEWQDNPEIPKPATFKSEPPKSKQEVLREALSMPAEKIDKTNESLLSFGKSAPATILHGLATGGNKLMSIINDPFVDTARGLPRGTTTTQRQQSIDDFKKENVTDQSLGTTILGAAAEAAPQMAPVARGAQALRAAGPVVANATANAALEGSKKFAEGGSGVESAKAAGLGALGSFGGDVGARVLGGFRTGATPFVQQAIDRGWLPTMGQAGGPVARVVENAAAKVPSLRGGIDAGRKDAWDSYSTSEANRVIEMARGAPTREVGERAVTASENAVDTLFDTVKPHIRLPPMAKSRAVAQTQNAINAMPGLTPRDRRTVVEIVNSELRPYTARGRALTGEEFKRMDANLGNEARRLENSTVVAEQRQGAAIRIAQRNLRDALRPTSSAPASTMRDLDAANRAYFENIPLRDAATKAGSKTGKFSPTQLQQANNRVDIPSETTLPAREIAERTPPTTSAPSTKGGTMLAAGAGTGAMLAAHNLGVDPLVALGIGGGTLLGASGLGSGISRGVNSKIGRTLTSRGLGFRVSAPQAQFLARLAAENQANKE